MNPDASQSEALDSANLLRSLEAAGLDSKRLDLTKVLGDRRDIDELNSVLHGAAGMRKSGWSDVSVKIVIFKV